MKKMNTAKALSYSKPHNSFKSLQKSESSRQPLNSKHSNLLSGLTTEDLKSIPQITEPKNIITEVIKYKHTESAKAVKINLVKEPFSSKFLVNKINTKGYIQLLNRLFKYLKKVLTNEVYDDIKRKFSEEINKYLNKVNHLFNRNDESQSSIFNYVKCDDIISKNERTLKLSYDFSQVKDKPVKIEHKTSNSNKKNITKTKMNIAVDNNNYDKNKKEHITPVITSITTVDNNINKDNMMTCNVNSKVLSESNGSNNSNSKTNQKQSLYNLTKSRIDSSNVSKSATTIARSPKKDMKKKQKYHNKNNCSHSGTRNKYSKSISRDMHSNHNVLFDLNQQSIRENKTQMTSIQSDRPINESHKKSYLKATKPLDLLNNKLRLKLNKCNKNNTSIEIDQYANANERGGSGSKTQRSSRSANSNKKSSDSYRKLPNNTYNNTTTNNKVTSLIYPMNQLNDAVPKQIRTQYIDLTKSDENRNEPRNDETIKIIKFSLDDDLKQMFNFSYEHFLSKESSSQSKKSQELNEALNELDNHSVIGRGGK